MSRLKIPYDKGSAKEVMKKFPDMAYSVNHKDVFQEAVHLLYGQEFRITVDLSKRMQFSCQICNRDMNSENAMAEHYRSGGHQKNLDKRVRETGQVNYQARAANYAKDSIQHKLLNSNVKPLGLQLIEEYINRKGSVYYKCNLCCSHGKLETIYNHIIGAKHTDKYIKTACVLENSVLTPNEREELRKKLVEIEGVNVKGIKTIRGDEYYPYKWEAEARTSKLYNEKFKKERRSLSASPEPGPSRRRRSSSSSSSSEDRGKHRSRRERSRSRSKSYHRSSKGRYRKHSGSNSDSSGNSRRTMSCSPKAPPPVIQVKTEPVDITDARRSLGRDEGDLYQFRNRSPPSLSRIKLEPYSSSYDGFETATVPVLAPPPAPHIKVDTKNKESQTMVDQDLEELMLQFNFIVKTEALNMSDCEVKSLKDLKTVIDIMHAISETLRQLTVNELSEGGSSMSSERRDFLLLQKEKREKIISYVTKRFQPTYEVLLREEQRARGNS